MAGASRRAVIGALAIWLTVVVLALESDTASPAAAQPAAAQSPHFDTSDNCLACHNSLTSPSGEDVSIGRAWRGSIMANSSRDPYWQASVRRETLDHPSHQAAIED